MIESIKEFWYLYLLIAVLLVVTLFVWKKAIAASAKRSKQFNENLAKAKRAKELREAYGDMTAEIISKAPAADLSENRKHKRLL